MAEYLRAMIDIVGHSGTLTSDVTVYLPFTDAAFAAQRSLTDRNLWLIVHMATTYIAVGHHAMLFTRKEALVLARRLSTECPSAAHIVRLPDGKVGGPVAKLSKEVQACLHGEPVV